MSFICTIREVTISCVHRDVMFFLSGDKVPLEPEEGNNKCWTRRHVVGFTNDTAVGVESTM